MCTYKSIEWAADARGLGAGYGRWIVEHDNPSMGHLVEKFCKEERFVTRRTTANVVAGIEECHRKPL